MKQTIICLLAATLSQAALAKEYSGKLQCFLHVMSQSDPGQLESVEIAGADSNNTEKTVLGPTVVVDLAAASKAKLTSVTKTLTNEKVFDGQLDFFLSFQYRGEIAAGNLSGLKIMLSQKGKNMFGQQIQFARSEVTSGIPDENPTRLEMFSNDGKLLLATVECGVAKN